MWRILNEIKGHWVKTTSSRKIGTSCQARQEPLGWFFHFHWSSDFTRYLPTTNF